MNKAEWEDLIALTQAERSAAWSRLDIREWTALGSKLADLKARFRERFPDDGAEPGRPEAMSLPAPSRRVAKEEMRKWLKKRVASHDPATPYPAEPEDLRAAEKALVGRISRQMFRAVRNEEVPKEWRHSGRRKLAAERGAGAAEGQRGRYAPK